MPETVVGGDPVAIESPIQFDAAYHIKQMQTVLKVV
jgi:hypothetical protein